MSTWPFAVTLLLSVVLTAQTPDPYGLVADTVPESFKVGVSYGKWIYVGQGSGSRQHFFVDPATTKYNKELSSWTCWVREIDYEANLEWKSKVAYRKDGDEAAVLSASSYKYPTGEVFTSRTSKVSDLQWDQVVPDSISDSMWRQIQPRTKTKHKPAK